MKLNLEPRQRQKQAEAARAKRMEAYAMLLEQVENGTKNENEKAEETAYDYLITI